MNFYINIHRSLTYKIKRNKHNTPVSLPKHPIEYEQYKQNFRLQNVKLVYEIRVTKQIANLYVRNLLHCLSDLCLLRVWTQRPGCECFVVLHSLVKENMYILICLCACMKVVVEFVCYE